MEKSEDLVAGFHCEDEEARSYCPCKRSLTPDGAWQEQQAFLLLARGI